MEKQNDWLLLPRKMMEGISGVISELRIKGWVERYQVEKNELGKLREIGRDEIIKLLICSIKVSGIFLIGDRDPLKVF